MSNKHSHGPRCPFCPKRSFKSLEALHAHQKARNHFPVSYVRDEEDEARAKLQAYHQDKLRGGK